MNDLDYLNHLGFSHVGAWRAGVKGLDYSVFPKFKAIGEKRWVLYAFTSGGVVLYIGKATIPFNQRMSGYRRPGVSQKTNIRNNALIAELIRGEQAVEIYVFEGEKKLDYRGTSLNLAAGLEDPLIAKIRPKWNMSGKLEVP